MHTAVIRADASLQIGTGHIYRCLALAHGLQKIGYTVFFLSRIQQNYLKCLVVENGFDMLPLESHCDNDSLENGWLGCSIEQDIKESQNLLNDLNVDLLVVDHYGITAQWMQSMRPYTHQILMIDDLANRVFDCDYLLNPNPSFTSCQYATKIPATCQLLLGSEYALLNEQFAMQRDEVRATRMNRHKSASKISKVLLSIGGVNSYIENVVKVLQSVQIKELAIVGKGDIPNIKEISFQIHSLGQVDDMWRWMGWADFAIGGAGSTTWERCCMGLPSAMWILADNQRRIAQVVETKRAGWILPDNDFDKTLCNILSTLNQHPEVYTEYADNASALCDGKGVERVCTMVKDNA